MDKEKKNRSGSQSNEGGKNKNTGDTKQTYQPGGPNKSNRQTVGSKRNERDDSLSEADKNTTKKGANSV
ncbi:MAG: hypothetical protein ABR502_06850 [Chitinophagaceae bacterium]